MPISSKLGDSTYLIPISAIAHHCVCTRTMVDVSMSSSVLLQRGSGEDISGHSLVSPIRGTQQKMLK